MDGLAPSTFTVDPLDLIAAMSTQDWVDRVTPAIQQVVLRYNLAGRSLVAIGPGAAVEEVAMLKAGMTCATFYDIDESSGLARRLPQIHRQDGTIRYILADFTTLTLPSEAADVLYVSGFTPDEMRRGSISAAHVAAGSPGRDPAWPDGENPLHPVLLTAADRLLTPGGTMILQSYCNGVDALANPRYVREWNISLARHGIWLIEAYAFREAPGVTLWVGFKSRKPRALAPIVRHFETAVARWQMYSRPPLTTFHGRSAIKTEIMRVWP